MNMSVVSTGHERACTLLKPLYMRQRLATVLVLIGTSACGQITVGDNEVPLDTGPDVPDAGFDVLDSGETNTGTVALNCIEVQLPESLPTEWPFETDQDTFESVFLTWAREENCTICHDLDGINGEAIPPLIIPESEVQAIDRSREEVWNVIAPSELKASASPLNGALWRHVPEHENYEVSYTYLPAQVRFLEDLVYDMWACQIPSTLAAQDAGPSCGEPPPPPPVDAGPDGGGLDAGPDAGVLDAGPDAGVTDSGDTEIGNPCYCDEQPDAGPFNNQYCAPSPP